MNTMDFHYLIDHDDPMMNIDIDVYTTIHLDVYHPFDSYLIERKRQLEKNKILSVRDRNMTDKFFISPSAKVE
jgi:hypothetical protein